MLTDFGFTYGPATVSRVCADAKFGVWIEIAGKRETVTIRVTKGGRLRVGGVCKKKERK